MKKLSPVLCVDAIEPVLPFWVERFGFEQVVAIPMGDALGFVILQKGGVELMYQTRDSIAHDLPGVADILPTGGSALFIEVDDLDAIARALDGIALVVPRRQTFYGADELIVRDPAGNVVTFAQFAAGPPPAA